MSVEFPTAEETAETKIKEMKITQKPEKPKEKEKKTKKRGRPKGSTSKKVTLEKYGKNPLAKGINFIVIEGLNRTWLKEVPFTEDEKKNIHIGEATVYAFEKYATKIPVDHPAVVFTGAAIELGALIVFKKQKEFKLKKAIEKKAK